MSVSIEKLIAEEDWDSARTAIERELMESPDNHWLITRLGLTYYEQCDYTRALEFSERAMVLAPECPLVLWDYAGTLEMLNRPADALPVFKQLIVRGADAIASDQCGEGLAWARGLAADCHYRIAGCFLKLGDPNRAIEHFERHLAVRGPECLSIYSVDKVRIELQHARAL